MSLKLFNFTVENTRTKEVARFTGQGDGIEDAWKEAMKNNGEAFRPSSNGVVRPRNTIAVDLPDGRHVSREQKHFESDFAFNEEREGTKEQKV